MLSMDMAEFRVEDIIRNFDETPATIRRDLAYLEKTGAIMRFHGFAKAVNPFPVRNIFFSQEKLAIAKQAASMVPDGTSVLFDSGTTTLCIANQLVNKRNLTVITNSLAIANALSNSSVTTLLTGGVLSGKQQSLCGPDAEMFLSRLQAPLLFLSTTGMMIPRGLTCISPFQASIKKALIKAAKRVILVCDSSKFNFPGLILFADFSEIDCIITSEPIKDDSLRDRLEKLGIETFITS
jgi:DeoR/GlpR family transcriptional regulator of sugar metabolism